MDVRAQAIEQDSLRRIVEMASLAPSAENTQPWQFVVGRDDLLVCLDMARTLESDLGHMLSVTAIGAAVENAVIAATTEGLRSEVACIAELLPAHRSASHVPLVRIRFEKDAAREPLADCIESRLTARRMDHHRHVDNALLNHVEKCCSGFPDVLVRWVRPQELREFAQLVGMGNQIRLEHQPFHQELYNNLRFTATEAQRTRDGLDVATLQLPPGLGKILVALRKWPRMNWANTFGFARFVARSAKLEVLHSGAVGFISVGAPEIRQFVQSGRAMERMWLMATQLGLCFHPTASLPVFLTHARTGGQQLKPQHRRLVADMSTRFNRLFPEVSRRSVQMAFRIGYGPTPKVRSLRRKVEEVLQFR
jgi:nitroreductase